MEGTGITSSPSTGQKNWDALLAQAGGHVLQSWSWGELKARFGWRVQRLALRRSQAQVLYRPLPAGLGTIAYVPKGPRLDYTSDSALAELVAEIRPLARRQRAICLKIEPDAAESPDLVANLQALGFRRSQQPIQPTRTLLVDLDAEPEALLKRMKQKTRYNIRLAGRKGVTVRSGTEADLPAFYQLMVLTAERDSFGIHAEEYYEAAYQLFAPQEQAEWLLAEHDGQLLAGIVVFALGDTAVYMYGASSNEKRKLMPNYLLQWEGMLWARARGCRRYDLWGVPDEDQESLEASFTERSDGLWGVYRFKRGFGGRLVRWSGAWDLVYAPLRYRLYSAAMQWQERGALSSLRLGGSD
jgi:lipid II:glycine glycyltransferase (peptidoglycan interpeptide bridge formation enzyme)